MLWPPKSFLDKLCYSFAEKSATRFAEKKDDAQRKYGYPNAFFMVREKRNFKTGPYSVWYYLITKTKRTEYPCFPPGNKNSYLNIKDFVKFITNRQITLIGKA